MADATGVMNQWGWPVPGRKVHEFVQQIAVPDGLSSMTRDTVLSADILLKIVPEALVKRL
jgi:hypothetical protein